MGGSKYYVVCVEYIDGGEYQELQLSEKLGQNGEKNPKFNLERRWGKCIKPYFCP